MIAATYPDESEDQDGDEYDDRLRWAILVAEFQHRQSQTQGEPGHQPYTFGKGADRRCCGSGEGRVHFTLINVQLTLSGQENQLSGQQKKHTLRRLAKVKLRTFKYAV